MKKKLLFVFSSLSIVLLLTLFLKNNRDPEKDLLLKNNSFIEGLRIIHKRDGNIIWTLNAKRADIIGNDDKARLSDVVMMIESKGMAIHAGSGLYDIPNRNLTLNGRITADAKDYTIVCDSVDWNNSTEEIKTKGDVRFESKKFNVEGIGMEADSAQRLRIFKNVKAIFYR
ncbi:MAG: LPS export ABC transporter periplasmic protein LptC [Nitrospirae bacterium]|nr:LPS export ABC transporter periplasmic protein LptC [Nitrospirota bacterium]